MLGLPCYDGLLGKHTTPNDIQVAVQNIIISTPNVLNVLSIDIDADYRARVVTISFTAETAYGQVGGTISNP